MPSKHQAGSSILSGRARNIKLKSQAIPFLALSIGLFFLPWLFEILEFPFPMAGSPIVQGFGALGGVLSVAWLILEIRYKK